jgi:hypothetical protein
MDISFDFSCALAGIPIAQSPMFETFSQKASRRPFVPRPTGYAVHRIKDKMRTNIIERGFAGGLLFTAVSLRASVNQINTQLGSGRPGMTVDISDSVLPAELVRYNCRKRLQKSY